MVRRLAVVLGVPVDDVTLDEALDRIEGFVAARARLRQVATANTDFIVRAQDDPELRHILCAADLVTADGMPVVWASRLLGGGLRERVTGADLVPALAERCARGGHRLYLLGAAPEVAQTAALRLREQFPGLVIAGVDSPPVAPLEAMDHAGILRRVNAARPDVLLVAFGNPKQEKWIHRHRDALDAAVAIGVGASLDFIAGRVARAPEWMQRSGTEWVWRLAGEPGRLWRRYLGDAVRFGPPVAWTWLQSPVPGTAPARSTVTVDTERTIRVAGRLGAPERDALLKLAVPASRGAPQVGVDLAECVHADSAGLGGLVGLAWWAREAGGAVWLLRVPPRVRALLRRQRLESSFRMEVGV